MERRDCQAQAASPVVHESPAPLGNGRTIHLDLAAVEESAAARLEDIRRKPLRIRLLMPEFWMGLWGAVATVQLLLSMAYPTVSPPALVDEGFVLFGVLFLHQGWRGLSIGLVMLRLRERGVLSELHLAGEHPLTAFAAIHRSFALRFETWSGLVVVPMVIEGFARPESRTFFIVGTAVATVLWIVQAATLRHRTGGGKTAQISTDDAWVLTCEGDALAPALWVYLKAHGFMLAVGVSYIIHSLVFGFGIPLFAAMAAIYLAGRGFRQRLGRLDAAGFERLYTAWVLRENSRELFRELTQHG